MKHWLLALFVVAACGGAKAPVDNKLPAPKADAFAIAVVMSGWEIWAGNDKQLPETDPARYPGALIAVTKAFEAAHLSGPDGSQGVVVTYADKAVVRAPLGPLASLTGAFGTQKDYFGTTGNELVKGVELGLAELKRSNVKRKVMIVLGDGNDTNNEAAHGRLAELRKQAAADGVEIHAFVYKSAVSNETNIVKELAPDMVVAPTADELQAKLGELLRKYGGK